MRSAPFICALLLIVSLMRANAHTENFAGTWSISPSDKPGEVRLRMEYRRSEAGDNESWSESNDVPIAQLHGLTFNDIRTGGNKAFIIVQDAGQFRADGSFSGGQGGGTWTFAPSGTFASALAQRGVGTPTDKEQFQLAMGRFKLSTLDTLLRKGFQRPSPGDLVAMVEHGVTGDYVDAMSGLRIEPKTVGELIRLQDRGVDARYAADMLRRAPQLSAEDLVELRDHGVSSEYMQALADGGYGNVVPSQAERMMDHGVGHDYVRALRRLGYHPNVDDLVRLVDHGVSVSFIERMRSHGYTHLSVDDLIRLRDHGF